MLRPLLLAVLAALLLPAAAHATDVQWFPAPTADAELVDIATGQDGNVWVTERKAMNLGRITPAGQWTEFPGATADSTDGLGPTRIVTGADGVLWFLTDAERKLARLDTATGTGTVVLDNGLYGFANLAAAPGGGTWTTFDTSSDADSEDNGVYRVNSDGSGKRLPAKYLGDLTPIAAAPDGSAYYADGGDAIKRVTDAGETTTFPAQGVEAVDEIATMAFDRAGTLWFGAYNPATGWFSRDQGGAIGRVVDGKAVAVPLRDAAVPRSMKLGPDGGIWFATNTGFARTDASGVVKVATLGANIRAITFGADGALYVVDQTNNRVGRVALNASTFPVSKGARPVFRSVGGLRKAAKAKALDVRCTLIDPGSCEVRATVTKKVARSLKLKSTTLGKGLANGAKAGEVRVRVGLSKQAARALGRARKARVTLAVTVRGPQAIGSARKTVTLKR